MARPAGDVGVDVGAGRVAVLPLVAPRGAHLCLRLADDLQNALLLAGACRPECQFAVVHVPKIRKT